jgi:hypothetical protein
MAVNKRLFHTIMFGSPDLVDLGFHISMDSTFLVVIIVVIVILLLLLLF